LRDLLIWGIRVRLAWWGLRASCCSGGLRPFPRLITSPWVIHAAFTRHSKGGHSKAECRSAVDIEKVYVIITIVILAPSKSP